MIGAHGRGAEPPDQASGFTRRNPGTAVQFGGDQAPSKSPERPELLFSEGGELREPVDPEPIDPAPERQAGLDRFEIGESHGDPAFSLGDQPGDGRHGHVDEKEIPDPAPAQEPQRFLFNAVALRIHDKETMVESPQVLLERISAPPGIMLKNEFRALRAEVHFDSEFPGDAFELGDPVDPVRDDHGALSRRSRIMYRTADAT